MTESEHGGFALNLTTSAVIPRTYHPSSCAGCGRLPGRRFGSLGLFPGVDLVKPRDALDQTKVAQGEEKPPWRGPPSPPRKMPHPLSTPSGQTPC
jgi:hypothetical protein